MSKCRHSSPFLARIVFAQIGESLVHLSRRKSIALLAYLALESGEHARDTLAAMLWPECAQSSARPIFAQPSRYCGKLQLRAYCMIAPCPICFRIVQMQ